MIDSVLVANRGEIARRIFRTCRELGIATVAVYSDADADAPHVREADAAVRLPGSAPSDTYLRGELIVEAAKRAGATAIHPGYGFLSENAEFARTVEAAGLVWIGPPAKAIETMGDKIEAKRSMAAAGVPVLTELDPDLLLDDGQPVLIKASAGGGGRGMRIVRAEAELPAALESAQAEALAAFGDATVFCEPYVERGHHVEVQLLADQHGTIWPVGERECSIQRRYQKVVEETPSPLVERHEGLREQLFDAAVAAARSVGYVGAGTVEFLADEDGRFFFLEMNTRLQVEHPVTECTTGLDLVALQLRIAAGEALPAQPPKPHGHAIEVRLYAEDPANGWQPQTGVLHRIEIPAPRVDSGVENGSTISPHYDALLAKVIAHARTRDEAVARLAGALQRAVLHGPATNRDLLVNVLRHPAFVAGETDTGFLDRHDVRVPRADERVRELSALAAALADAAANRAEASVNGGLPSGWRNVPSQPQRKSFDGYDVAYRITRRGLEGYEGVELVRSSSTEVVLDLAGVRRTFAVATYDGDVFVDSALGAVRLKALPRFTDPADEVVPGSLLAPMPGTVARIAIRVGDPVTKGQPLLWLEAMKMEHPVLAPADGVVAELPVEVGRQVDVDSVLAIVRSEEGP